MLFLTPNRAFNVSAAIFLSLCAISFFAVRPSTLVYFADYWEHRAIINEVIRGGTHLLDPVYGENASSRQYSPWSLALGYLARLFHLSVDTAMACGAMAVSMIFVIGVRSFARAFYANDWAPTVLFATLTCGWGVPALIWTGFYSFRSQLHGNYYPAALVFALTFVAWARTLRLLRTNAGGVPNAIVLWAVVACSVITHPLNAAFLVAGAMGFIVLEPSIAMARRCQVGLIIAVGVISTVFWPYFNPLSLASAGLVRGQATFNNFHFFYDPIFVIALAWPAMFALLGVPGLVRNRAMWMPLLGFGGTFLAYVAGGLADVSVSHRLLAYVILMLHLLLTRAIVDTLDGQPPRMMDRLTPRAWRGVYRAAVLLVVCQVAMAAQQLVQPWALAGYRHEVYKVDADASRVAATLPPGARVLGWESAALVMPSHGVLVAAFPRPMPLSPSDAARQADYQRFFMYRTSACERLAIARRWHATHIAFLTIELPWYKQYQLARLGPATSPVQPWRIIKVADPGTVGC